MILDKDINPERSLYYLGGKVIEELIEIKGKKVDFLSLYNKVNNKTNISMQLFILTIDWLFLLEIINSDENGVIKKCF